MAPPKASTSKASAHATTKLTPTEKKLIEAGLAAPRGQITQADLLNKCGLSGQTAVDAINSILRKNLAQLLKTSSGDVEFRFIGKDEAKAMGSMDSEEKLVLDHIKDSDNMGIWTKFLTNKTGLPRATINKVLKTLESRKTVKIVKSVKYPTRKIYMLATIQPSVELTGGPWFTDNELDLEFVEALKSICLQYLARQTRPRKVKTSNLAPGELARMPVWPVSGSPHLPKVRDVLKYIQDSEVAVQVELYEEHVESLLELMIYEGKVERILVQTPENGFGSKRKGKKRKRVAANSSEEENSDDEATSRRRKKSAAKKKNGGASRKSNGKASRKKKRLDSNALDDDNEDNDSSASEDFDEDEDQEEYQRRKAAQPDDGSLKSTTRRQKKRIKAVGKVKRDPDDSDVSMDDATSESSASDRDNDGDEDDEGLLSHHREGGVNDYVYRLIRPYAPVIGWTDMPCGKCPVESFCTEPARRFATAAKRPTWLLPSGRGTGNSGLPRIGVQLEGGMQGVGMIGGAGAAIGISTAKWGETKGAVGAGVAPVNPRDCHYFQKWLDF